jgi:hypothetical protein
MYLSDIISAVKARQAEIKESLAEGYVVNFETYQRLVGEYAGLQTALDIIDNILKEKEERNNEQ